VQRNTGMFDLIPFFRRLALLFSAPLADALPASKQLAGQVSGAGEAASDPDFSIPAIGKVVKKF